MDKLLGKSKSNDAKIIGKDSVGYGYGSRAPTGSQKQMLRACEESKRCFYCNKSAEDTSIQIHYDHFIPWSFLYETETWNLVVSCQTCNISKSDTLAPESYM